MHTQRQRWNLALTQNVFVCSSSIFKHICLSELHLSANFLIGIETKNMTRIITNNYYNCFKLLFFDDLLIQITDTRWSDLVPASITTINTMLTSFLVETVFVYVYKWLCLCCNNIFLMWRFEHYLVCCTSSDLRVEVNGQPF